MPLKSVKIMPGIINFFTLSEIERERKQTYRLNLKDQDKKIKAYRI